MPGMLQDAAKLHDIDLDKSVMIGDKLADIEAGVSAGCRTILVRTGYGAGEEQFVGDQTTVCDDLLSAVKLLLNLNQDWTCSPG
jgi:D-glycero-D-manno-heptose 1,7-bisphosphate phosphatase